MRWILIGFLIVLVISFYSVFAEPPVDYERTPLGYSVESPILINISANSFEDLIGYDPEITKEAENYWTAYITNSDFSEFYLANTCLASSTLSGQFAISAPIGFKAWYVLPKVGPTISQCIDPLNNTGGVEWEGNGKEPIFEIVEHAESSGLVSSISKILTGSESTSTSSTSTSSTSTSPSISSTTSTTSTATITTTSEEELTTEPIIESEPAPESETAPAPEITSESEPELTE